MTRLFFFALALATCSVAACSQTTSAPLASPTQPTPDTQATITTSVVRTLTVVAVTTAAAQPSPTDPPIASPTPALARVVVATGLMSFPAGTDIPSMSEALSALVSQSPGTVDRLRVTGRVFDVNDGDEGTLVQSQFSSARVRFTSGNATGKTLWLPEKYVRPISP